MSNKSTTVIWFFSNNLIVGGSFFAPWLSSQSLPTRDFIFKSTIAALRLVLCICNSGLFDRIRRDGLRSMWPYAERWPQVHLTVCGEMACQVHLTVYGERPASEPSWPASPYRPPSTKQLRGDFTLTESGLPYRPSSTQQLIGDFTLTKWRKRLRKSLLWPGASQWRIYYHGMWGQLSTTCSNLLMQPNGELIVAVDHSQLRTMASNMVDPIDWSQPPTLMGSTPWAPSCIV